MLQQCYRSRGKTSIKILLYDFLIKGEYNEVGDLFMVALQSTQLTGGYLEGANLEWKQIVVKSEEILLGKKRVAGSHQIGVLV